MTGRIIVAMILAMNARANPAKLKADAAPTAPALSDLIAVATKAKASVGEIHDAYLSARDLVEAAVADAIRAERSYQAALLADEATLAKAVEERQAVTIRRDRARALVDALDSRLFAAETDAAERNRRVRYDEAKAKSAAAVEAIRSEYPEIGRRLRQLLGQLAQADVAIIAVNADLPAGAETLSSPEDLVRSEMAKPKLILSETDVSLWCDGDSHRPIPDEYQAAIVAGPDGRGSRRGTATTGSANYGYIRRPFRRVEFLKATSAMWADRLASKIALPGFLPGDDDLWHPEWGYSGPFPFDPAQVLKTLADTEPPTINPAAADADDRDVCVEYVPVSEPTPAQSAH